MYHTANESIKKKIIECLMLKDVEMFENYVSYYPVYIHAIS